MAVETLTRCDIKVGEDYYQGVDVNLHFDDYDCMSHVVIYRERMKTMIVFPSENDRVTIYQE